MQDADYVIIGGGSAGCVLAARLSEDSTKRVLLIEAGGDGKGWKIDMPAGPIFLLGQDKYDWRYEAEPDPTLGGRSISWPAGRMLGGGSSINGQVYLRGTRGDFDDWAADGCPGWGFDDVLPYFKKAETYEGPTPLPSHGTSGPLSVSAPRHKHPLLKNFVQGFHQLGLPILDDYCGGDQLGVYETLATNRAGKRCSTARAYLEPAKNRPNLQIITDAYVRKLIVFEGRVSGIELSRGNVVSTIPVRGETIVSAGAIGSPALLLRSGIGPAEELRAAGVQPVLDVPGVGRNLQEHPATLMGRLVNVPTYNSQMTLFHKVSFALNYFLRTQGPLTSIGGQGLAFAKTREDLAEPDIQYHFSAALYAFDAEGKPMMEPRPGVQISANVCRPYSRGQIRLRDAGLDSRPIIDHQAFADPRDMATLIAGCKLGDRVFDTPAFKPAIVGRYTPATTLTSDQEWEAYIRKHALLAYHPVGSCRMGSGPDAVVDPSLRMRGIKGLRVADASIMPTLVSANTNAASIMIGEKAADLIRRGA